MHLNNLKKQTASKFSLGPLKKDVDTYFEAEKNIMFFCSQQVEQGCYLKSFFGSQTKCPKTKCPKGQNVLL